jgi:hypothetical protein
VSQPKAKGLGSALIVGGIPNAQVEHEFRPHGVICKIELPLPTGPLDTD